MIKPSRGRDKEYKLIHIIVGLTIGFFMGGVVVYYGFSRGNASLLITDINLYKNQKEINSKDTANIYNYSYFINEIYRDYYKEDIQIKDTTTSIKEVINNNKVTANYIDSLSPEINNEVVTDKLDTTTQLIDKGDDYYYFRDTLKIEKDKQLTEDFKVKKDELIYVKVLDNPKIDEDTLTTSYPELDSIMGKNVTSQNKDILIVEFWETPLNSRVYKKGKNKIILYGISLYDFASFKDHNGTLYLKYLNQYYPLEFTFDYKSLEPVSDLALVDQLQQL